MGVAAVGSVQGALKMRRTSARGRLSFSDKETGRDRSFGHEGRFPRRTVDCRVRDNYWWVRRTLGNGGRLGRGRYA